MGVEKLLEDIERGKQGKNIGISTGLPDIDKILYGIQRRYLYTVGGDTSSGKTSFGLDIFIYNLIKNAGDKKINILYYSFEMASEILFAKLLSRYIWDEYKTVITYEDILSLSSTITQEKLDIINKSIPWLNKIEQSLTIYDKPLTPGHIYGTLKEWLRKFGTFIPIGEHKEDYIENDETEYKVVVIDHMGLINGQGTKKELIDTTVEYFVYFRNKCGITGIFIQQLNRGQKSMDRKLNGYELIQLDDFKDTSGTTDASEVVIGLYYPYREKIARVEGYPIQNVLKDKFRLVQILKDRYGRSDVNKGVIFYGEIGMFKELPRPDEISDYGKYLKLEEQIDEAKTTDNDDNIFKF